MPPPSLPQIDGRSCVNAAAVSDSEIVMDESWLPTLNTKTPQEGFELAVKAPDLRVCSLLSVPRILVRELCW
jgi:hypothetical protein